MTLRVPALKPCQRPALLVALWVALVAAPVRAQTPDGVASSTAAPSPAAAAGLGEIMSAGGDAPVEIEADQALEWDQQNRTYLARGNAVARRGDASVRADRLIAFYRESQAAGVQVFRFKAEGNVVIESPGNRAEGAEATYDLDSRVAVLTGGDLKLSANNATITATDRLEYHEKDNKALAIGNARVVRQDNILEADTMTAFFGPGPKGEIALKKVDATGDVRITGKDRIATGEAGSYDAVSQRATLSGGVRLCEERRGLATGQTLVVNMDTGRADLTGNGGSSRPRIVLQPGKQATAQAGFDPCAALRRGRP